MDRSEELWGEIKEQILAEQLATEEELQGLTPSVIEGRVTSDDWKIAIENSLLRGDDDAQ